MYSGEIVWVKVVVSKGSQKLQYWKKQTEGKGRRVSNMEFSGVK